MPQGDLNIANQSGAAFRADLNNQLLALGTLQSGNAEPSTTYAYQLWADTTANELKQRNAANNGWIVLGAIGSANLGLLPLTGGTLTGSLTGPAFIPTGSSAPTNGLYLPSANTVGITTNGSEHLRIASSGNVGIGTGSPSARLEVNGASIIGKDLANSVAITGSNGGNAGIGQHTTDADINIYGNGTGSIRFRTEASFFGSGTVQSTGSERMRITAGGLVGIGTTNPERELQVVGSIRAGDASGRHVVFTGGPSNNSIISRDGVMASSGHPLAFLTGSGAGAESMRLDTSGRLLVGTSSVSGLNAAKTVINETSAVAAQRIVGNSNTQGAAQKITVVRHYPVVSLGTKLIIPIVSQPNLNVTTICKVWGHGARHNSSAPLPFEITFACGHLGTISNLTSWGGQGNYSSIAANGMNIEITFTTAYTSATANGVYVCLEYMTPVAESSVNVAAIAMN